MKTSGVSKRRVAGFTLIELMIAVVVVGILAAVAMPTYQDYVRRGYRTSAEAFLMDVAQREQQYFMDSRSYASSVTGSTGLGMTIPADVQGRYTIAVTVVAGPPPTFSVAATPTGNQTNDSCGTLTLTSAGAKTSSSGSNCW